MEKINNNFLTTRDGEKIFYSTNFKPGEHKEPVIIFNYGLVCSNFHWSKQLPFFEEQGYSIIIHDYRGHYQSTGMDNLENITFENITGDIEELLIHLGVDKTIMVGHSMGANISLEYALRNPDHILGLVLISGTVIPVKNIMFDSNVMEIATPYLETLMKKYPKIFETVWGSSGMNPIIKKIVHFSGFNAKTVPAEFVEIYLNKLGKLGPQLFFQLFDQLSKHNVLSKLNTLVAPTLIIGGDRDNVIPNHLQFTLKQQIDNSELYILRKGSHVPQVDFPDFINERILYFIRESIKAQAL